MMHVVGAIVGMASAFLSAARPQQVIRSTSDLVPVYVTVTGRDGRQIKGLTVADFTVTDGGRPRVITVFSADRRPFAVALVFDSTGSMAMGAGFGRSAAFARGFVDALDPDDQIAIGSLAREIYPLSPEKAGALQLLKQSPMQLSRDFNARYADQLEVETERGVDWAIESLALVDGRRIVVLLTDGRNPEMSGDERRADAAGYRLPAATAIAVIRRAERADASIHAIAFDDTMVEEQFLTAFASTGGGASLIARDADLAAVGRELVDELHHEYLLGFTPTQFDGKSHKIQVKVNRQGARVRSRTTYFAPQR